MIQRTHDHRRQMTLGLVIDAVSGVLKSRGKLRIPVAEHSVIIGAPEALLDSLGIVMALSTLEADLTKRPTLLGGVSSDRLFDRLTGIVTVASLTDDLILLSEQSASNE